MTTNLPDTLYAKIRVKRSIIPGEIPVSLDLGEIAVNIPDQKIYIGDDSGDVITLFESEVYTAGTGISINQSNQISFNPNDSFTINLNKISASGISGLSQGYAYWNGTTWSLDIPETNTELQYFAGSGLDLSTENEFSVNLSTITKGQLSTEFIKGGQISGYLFWNSSTNLWEYRTITSGEGGEIYYAGMGLNLNTNNEFSVDLGSITSGSLQLDRLDRGNANTGELLQWNGTQWNPSQEISGGSASSFS